MRYLLQPVTLCIRYFPQLAACYLLGYLGRTGAIELAARVGYDNDLWASLIMPLAGMARLGSYVAMFLVIRHGIPTLAALPARKARQVDMFATIIVPFFAIYLAWQMFREDWITFLYATLAYKVGGPASATATEIDPRMLPVSTVTLVVIGAAFVVRIVLARYKNRLPAWLLAVQLYLDALWVFLILTFSASRGVTLVINPSAWIAERRIIVWFNETRESVFSHVQLLETVWKGLMWAVGTVFGGAAVPLVWLAVACIVYGAAEKADWHSEVRRRLGGHRAGRWIDPESTRTRLDTRWKRVPGKVRTELREQVGQQIGKFKPIVDSAHVIIAGGVFALSLYVLAYLGLAWLDMSGSYLRTQIGPGYLFRGMAGLLGPHDIMFWLGIWEPIELISHVITEPLRICLVAVTLGWCLDRMRLRDTTTTAPNEPVSLR